MATALMTALETLRDRLALVDGVKTCRIGMESTITPDDYPIVRIVPSRIEQGQSLDGRKCEALIYFGVPLHEFDQGLESLYSELLDLEAALIQAAVYQSGVYCTWIETIMDEDRTEAFKMLALSVRIEA